LKPVESLLPVARTHIEWWRRHETWCSSLEEDAISILSCEENVVKFELII